MHRQESSKRKKAVPVCNTCEKCGLTLCSRQSLANHRAKVHLMRQVFQCQLCGRMYSSQRYLNNHMFNEHSSDREKQPEPHAQSQSQHNMFECGLCGHLFSSQLFLDKHKHLEHVKNKDVTKQDLQRLLQQKLPLRKIAALLEISRPTLYKLLRKHGLDSAFKNVTNEKLVARMQAIVAECPEAASDPNLMMVRLRQQDFFVGMSRLVFCMQKYLGGYGTFSEGPASGQSYPSSEFGGFNS
ncbi:hypothetical protein ACOMHN_022999 [Nucella lapillus]